MDIINGVLDTKLTMSDDGINRRKVLKNIGGISVASIGVSGTSSGNVTGGFDFSTESDDEVRQRAIDLAIEDHELKTILEVLNDELDTAFSSEEFDELTEKTVFNISTEDAGSFRAVQFEKSLSGSKSLQLLVPLKNAVSTRAVISSDSDARSRSRRRVHRDDSPEQLDLFFVGGDQTEQIVAQSDDVGSATDVKRPAEKVAKASVDIGSIESKLQSYAQEADSGAVTGQDHDGFMPHPLEHPDCNTDYPWRSESECICDSLPDWNCYDCRQIMSLFNTIDCGMSAFLVRSVACSAATSYTGVGPLGCTVGLAVACFVVMNYGLANPRELCETGCACDPDNDPRR